MTILATSAASTSLLNPPEHSSKSFTDLGGEKHPAPSSARDILSDLRGYPLRPLDRAPQGTRRIGAGSGASSIGSPRPGVGRRVRSKSSSGAPADSAGLAPEGASRLVVGGRAAHPAVPVEVRAPGRARRLLLRQCRGEHGLRVRWFLGFSGRLAAFGCGGNRVLRGPLGRGLLRHSDLLDESSDRVIFVRRRRTLPLHSATATARRLTPPAAREQRRPTTRRDRRPACPPSGRYARGAVAALVGCHGGPPGSLARPAGPRPTHPTHQMTRSGRAVTPKSDQSHRYHRTITS